VAARQVFTGQYFMVGYGDLFGPFRDRAHARKEVDESERASVEGNKDCTPNTDLRGRSLIAQRVYREHCGIFTQRCHMLDAPAKSASLNGTDHRTNHKQFFGIRAESFIALVLFSAFALLFFSPSFTNYFVADDFYFLGRIDFHTAGSYLTESWGYGNEYRPAVAYSYALDSAGSGKNPVGYHLTNTVLHTVNALLIGTMVVLIGGSLPVAILASIIFLLNPIAHESVIWISGRPAVLGSLFVLSACHFLLRAARKQGKAFWPWVAGYVSFVLGLFTYEIAVVTPFLAVLVIQIGGGTDAKNRRHFVLLFILTAVYILLWNWFFDFRITRFPVESSASGAVSSFARALTHSMHGSLRLRIAWFYVLLLALLVGRKSGRKLMLLALMWFFFAYLPFLIVQGYADRFAYLASAATAVVLAAALHDLLKRSLPAGVVAATLLLAFQATGMQHRIRGWKEAGEIARSITQDIKHILPAFPEHRLLVLLNVPQMHDRAYVYFSGLDRALQLEYPGATIKFATQLRPWADENSIILEYSGGKMIQRQFQEVQSRYP